MLKENKTKTVTHFNLRAATCQEFFTSLSLTFLLCRIKTLDQMIFNILSISKFSNSGGTKYSVQLGWSRKGRGTFSSDVVQLNAHRYGIPIQSPLQSILLSCLNRIPYGKKSDLLLKFYVLLIRACRDIRGFPSLPSLPFDNCLTTWPNRLEKIRSESLAEIPHACRLETNPLETLVASVG